MNLVSMVLFILLRKLLIGVRDILHLFCNILDGIQEHLKMANFDGLNKPGGYPHKYRPDDRQYYGGNFDDVYRSDKNNSDRNRAGHSANNERGRSHPLGLTGREIGLFYRDRARKKVLNTSDISADEVSHFFSIDKKTQEMIRDSLEILQKSEDEGAMSDEENATKEKYTNIKKSNFKTKFLNIVFGSIQEKLSLMVETSPLNNDDDLNERLIQEHEKRLSMKKYQSMLKFRSKLPSYKMKDEILDVIGENQVVVISGETGCGKTTQIPQFILDNAIENNCGSITKIVCTQPRRISTISVAERIAAERGENLGISVGYQIRLEKILCRDRGSILFCTTGMLLRYMQNDPALRDFSHIILDEIHERNTESDFIITLLKQVIPKRPDLKIILMSATLNADTFSKYYDNCPNIHIPGFTFPVTEYYLEDIISLTRYKFPNVSLPTNYMKHLKQFKDKRIEQDTFLNFIDPVLKQMRIEGSYPDYVINELRNPESETFSLILIRELLIYICNHKPPGAILVFLPGTMDISNLVKALVSSGQFPSYKYKIYPLHSRLPTAEQKIIFQIPPPDVRKIVIATSIAETSITIEDIVYIVDSGKIKLARFDVCTNTEALKPEWVTLANAKQRRGRAGRVKPGECYRLYSRAREQTFDQFPTPEMLRTPLENVILQAKILQLGRVDVFLGSVMDPPTDKAINASLELLRTLHAIDDAENLTPLGYHLAQLPLDPRTGKMVIWAAMFSCVEPVFAIAASLSFKDAFICPIGKEEQADEKKLQFGLGEYSDHIALAEAIRQYEQCYSSRAAYQFAHENFLSENTLNLLIEMKYQFAKYLYEMKLLCSDDPCDARSNQNSENKAVIKAIVCAGLFPNIAIVSGTLKHPHFITGANSERAKIHPSSINHNQQLFPTPFITYYLKQKSTAVFLHDTTCVSAAALIFAIPKHFIRLMHNRWVVFIHNIPILRCERKTGELVLKLHDELDKFLTHKISNPNPLNWSTRESDIIRMVIELFSESEPTNFIGKRVQRPRR